MTPYEEISKSYGKSTGKPDANLANDSNKLGGIEAEDYATKQWVKNYHGKKEDILKEDIDKNNKKILEQAKEYTNGVIRDIDYSDFITKRNDLPALKTLINNAEKNAKDSANEYTNTEITKITNNISNKLTPDINNLKTRVSTAEGNIENLFQSVSDGKYKVAKAITGKGVQTLAKDSFETMANNINLIKQEGVGNITITGTDTSDATATASDILSGKTAYVDGNKIIGTYKPSIQIGTDFPTGEVEPIYETIATETKVYEEEFSIPSNVNIYGINNNGKDMLGYDTSDNKLKFYRLIYGTTSCYFGQVVDQEENKATKEYSLSDLGITGNKTVKDICFSGAEIEAVAITLLNTDTNKIEFYIFRIKKNGYGYYEISTTNSSDENGTYSYVKWHITTNYEDIKDVKFSPYSFKLAVLLGTDKIYFTMYKLYTQFKEATDSEYGYVVKGTDNRVTVGGGNSNTTRKFKLSSNEKLLSVYSAEVSYYGVWIEQRLYVLDDNYTVIGQTEVCNIDLTADGEYGIGQNKLYKMNIDYNNGTITYTELNAHGITLPETSGESATRFDRGGIFGCFLADSFVYLTERNVYSIDFEKTTVTLLATTPPSHTVSFYDPTSVYHKFLPNGKTIMIRRQNGYGYISNAYNTERLVGIRYNGIEWIKKGADTDV